MTVQRPTCSECLLQSRGGVGACVDTVTAYHVVCTMLGQWLDGDWQDSTRSVAYVCQTLLVDVS